MTKYKFSTGKISKQLAKQLAEICEGYGRSYTVDYLGEIKDDFEEASK